MYLQDEEYKKFWEELFTHIPFSVILVFDTASRKKSLICMRNEVSKTIQFGRLHGMMELFMKCAVKMASDGMIYISNFMKVD
jgi:O-methyltransferase involved in polyketide biosynthesis